MKYYSAMIVSTKPINVIDGKDGVVQVEFNLNDNEIRHFLVGGFDIGVNEKSMMTANAFVPKFFCTDKKVREQGVGATISAAIADWFRRVTLSFSYVSLYRLRGARKKALTYAVLND